MNLILKIGGSSSLYGPLIARHTPESTLFEHGGRNLGWRIRWTKAAPCLSCCFNVVLMGTLRVAHPTTNFWERVKVQIINLTILCLAGARRSQNVILFDDLLIDNDKTGRLSND